jgi:hypothetical protein
MGSRARRQPPVAIAIHLAEGIDYETIPGAPAPTFRCERYRATLMVTACATRWRKAQEARGEAGDAVALCRACPIGAGHAGEAVVRYSRLYRSDICPRCGRGSGRRLVGGTRCIGCYNREREFIRGRNGKGTRPIRAVSLHRRTVKFAVAGGAVESMTIKHSADLAEVMLAALRNRRGRLLFHFEGLGPAGRAEGA